MARNVTTEYYCTEYVRVYFPLYINEMKRNDLWLNVKRKTYFYTKRFQSTRYTQDIDSNEQILDCKHKLAHTEKKELHLT